VSAVGPEEDRYGPLCNHEELPYRPDGPGFLWVRATAPLSQPAQAT
jgi:hypothetical protein